MKSEDAKKPRAKGKVKGKKDWEKRVRMKSEGEACLLLLKEKVGGEEE